MKYLIYAFVFLFSKLMFAEIHETIQDGEWTNITTWNNNSIPTPTDTIIVSHALAINTSTAICKHVNLNNLISFNSASNLLTAETIIVSSGEINGQSTGAIAANKLIINDSLTIGRCDLTIADTTTNNGYITLNGRSGNKSLGNFLNYGEIESPDGEDLYLTRTFTNFGICDLSDAKITFSDSGSISSSSLLKIAELYSSSVIINRDTLVVLEKLDCPKLTNQGYLELVMTNSSFNCDSLMNFNTVAYAREGSQTVKNLSNSNQADLIFKNEGNFYLEDSLFLGHLTLENGARLVLSTFLNGDSITVQDSSRITFDEFYNIDSVPNLNFAKQSTLVLKEHFEPKKEILQVGNIDIAPGIELDLTNCDSLRIAGSSSGAGEFINPQIVEYNGTEEQSIEPVPYPRLIINNSGAQPLSLSDDNAIDHLIIKAGNLAVNSNRINNLIVHPNTQLTVTGYAPLIDSALVSGDFVIKSDLARPEINYINITENGKFLNQSAADINIQNIQCDGVFEGCSGTACDYSSNSDTLITGGISKISLARVAVKQILNFGQLEIVKELNCDTLVNLENSILLLGLDTQNISGHLNLTKDNNTVIFNKLGDQIIPKQIEEFQNLTIQNTGKKILSRDLVINGNLTLNQSSTMACDSFQVTGDSHFHFNMDSAATLLLGHNFSARAIPFPSNYTKSKINLHPTSTVIYKSKQNQSISTIPVYGNLTVDDGAVTSSTKEITGGDSLVVKGNFDLLESSLTVKSNLPIVLYKDWDGIGNIEISHDLFIHGDGNNDGLLTQHSGSVNYVGNAYQRIKVGHYKLLNINNSSTAYTRANTGELIVDTLNVLDGTLEFTTEKVTIHNLNVWGNVIFSSKLQEKQFENIHVYPTGQFDFDTDETILIHGDIKNDGIFKHSIGVIQFTDTTTAQTISGNSELELSKVIIDKKNDSLIINCDVALQDTLSLEAGKLYIENAIVNLAASGYLAGENETKCIFGNGDAAIKTEVLLLPGTHTNIKGIGLNITTATPFGTTQLERRFNAATLIDQPSIQKSFHIDPQFNQGHNATISFKIWQHELNNNTPENLKIWKSTDGINWMERGGAYDEANKLMKIDNIASFSLWTAGSKTPTALAVELISFEGKRAEGKVLLNWKVLSEMNTNRYLINYSTNGVDFDSLTTVTASNAYNYSFSYYENKNQPLYIELVEVENNGNRIHLDTIYIPYSISEQPIAWLKNGSLFFKNIERGKFDIYDNRGRLIYSDYISKNQYNLQLKQGMYLIAVQNEIGNWSFKLGN